MVPRKAFKGLARTYTVEIVDSSDLSVQFTISKPYIENFLKGLSAKMKGLKYQERASINFISHDR